MIQQERTGQQRKPAALGPGGQKPLALAIGLLLAMGLLVWIAGAGIRWLTSDSFVYTNQLLNNGKAVLGDCDFRFGLFTGKFGGQRIGDAQSRKLSLDGGRFSTDLDFGADWLALKDLYVDVAARCPSGRGSYTQLLRQRLGERKPFEMLGLARLAEGALAAKDVAPVGEAGQEPVPATGSDGDSQDLAPATTPEDDDRGPALGTTEDSNPAAQPDDGAVTAVTLDSDSGNLGTKRIRRQQLAEQPSAAPGLKRYGGRKGALSR